MHVIIIGGGPVGDSLLRLALADGHDAALIESDADIAEALAQKYDALILNASITTDEIMAEAGGHRAGALIATTSDDAANLMAMVLGQEAGIENLISVVNQKSHKALFERLQIRVLMDPEILVAQHLLDLALHPQAEDVTTLADHEQIYELRLTGASPLIDRSLADIHADNALPSDTFIVSVERDGQRFFPRDETRLAADDELIVFARKSLSQAALTRMTGQ